MTIAHWLAIILALTAFTYRKRLRTMLQWHPLVLAGHVLFIAGVVGFYFLIRWLYEEYAWWGLGGFLLFGILLHAWHRRRYGYWLGDDRPL